jgi:hypothetical protein
MEIKSIPLEQLQLDKGNPRIHQTISPHITQINLAKFIYDNFGINDLKDSIKKNGYFLVEPMVAIPANDGTDNLIVVEGNRRLTTIKILCNDEYRNSCVSVGRIDEYIATESLKKSLEKIPVVVAANKESVTAYLGVRHLGGVVRWQPLAQSKYVYNQVLLEKDKSANKSISDAIAKFVEETNNSKKDVLNHFYKYCIYQYMLRLIDEDHTLNASIENKFSLLEVALGTTGRTTIAKYIGIESYNRLDPEDYESILPEGKDDKIKNFIKWVFTTPPIINESRELNKYLKKILSNPVSTLAFEQGEDKDTALLLAKSYDNIVKSSCERIHKNLTLIQQNWDKTDPDNRNDLRKIYKANVVEKIDSTNKAVDID